MPTPAWISRFVGIPYQEGGESYGGADCYGLVRLVYREIFGQEVPRLPAGERTEAKAGADTGKWVRSREGRVGDVVALTINGVPSHCGVVVGVGLMLHAIRDQHSAIEHFDSVRWLKRFDGFYRLESARD